MGKESFTGAMTNTERMLRPILKMFVRMSLGIIIIPTAGRKL